MSDRGPFSKWPNLDDREREKEPARRLPGSTPLKDEDMPQNNALESFLGGSPLSVAVKLIFMSLVVGALLMWLNLRPHDLLLALRNFVDSIYNMGFDAVRALAEYVVAGAVIVVPIWFILRLMNSGGNR
jgi:hypothetical protein